MRNSSAIPRSDPGARSSRAQAFVSKSLAVALGLSLGGCTAESPTAPDLEDPPAPQLTTFVTGSVDLSTWTEESYEAVSGSGASWNVSEDNTSVLQSVNGQPTLFYGDFDALRTEVRGVIEVKTTSDDDFIGFALGFEPGDTSNPDADYLLVDWKQGTQSFNFGTPSCTPGSTAQVGLAVSRVFGVPTADELWGHVNFDASCSDLDNGVEELARAINLGSTGWANHQPYTFAFEFTASLLRVYVDDELELEVEGEFSDGRLAFYNFSQAHVDYSAFTVDIINSAPEADAGGPYTADEGGSVALEGSGTDADDDPLTFAWDLDDDGDFETSGQSPTFSAADLDGPDTRTIVLQVCDDLGACETEATTVSIENVPPELGEISAPVDPVPVGTSVTAEASFTDAGTPDTHTAEWNWGDGTVEPGTVSQGAGSGSVSDEHAYAAAGVYTLGLTVADDDGGSDAAAFEYVVVFDPDGGFVTGAGWIDSPAGAYTPDPTLAGPARFGFVSKYKKGASTPSGNTRFQFRVADLSFRSSEYDWLVIAGPKAQFKGSGTVNGSGDYGFLLTANDGEVNGGGGVDRFRIKIWDKASETVIYDNQLGDDADAGATDAIEGGKIVIHR